MANKIIDAHVCVKLSVSGRNASPDKRPRAQSRCRACLKQSSSTMFSWQGGSVRAMKTEIGRSHVPSIVMMQNFLQEVHANGGV